MRNNLIEVARKVLPKPLRGLLSFAFYRRPRVHSSGRGGTIVLLYHRVFDTDSDPLGLSVSPERFAEHLEVVRSHADIVPLVETFGHGSRPRVAITLDDGYADNLWNALPILESMDAPATLFVTNAQIGKNREFWWDQLEQILMEAEGQPELVFADRKLTLDLSTKRSREHACLVVFDMIKHRQGGVIADDLATISSRLQVPVTFRPLNRTMTQAELQEVAASPIIEVGAHTVGHPLLRSLSSEDQLAEIGKSRHRLEEMIGGPVRSFAYPFGGHDSFSRKTVSIVERTGFEFACTSVPGHVSGRTSHFLIPRNLVRNWDRSEFEDHLSNWLGV